MLRTENCEELCFELNKDLIYFLDNGRKRLCVPKNQLKPIFEMAHDLRNHLGFHRAYSSLVEGIYALRLAHHLRRYIKHCPACERNQTKRHRPYGSLVPLVTPNVPFHTWTIDFILGLPQTKEGYDCALSITDKFTKRIRVLPGISTYNAEEWPIVLLDGTHD